MTGDAAQGENFSSQQVLLSVFHSLDVARTKKIVRIELSVMEELVDDLSVELFKAKIIHPLKKLLQDQYCWGSLAPSLNLFVEHVPLFILIFSLLKF